MIRYLIVLLLLACWSCKTVKTDRSTMLDFSTDSVAHRELDTQLFSGRILEEVLSDEYSITQRRQSYESLDSAGTTVLKPVLEETIFTRRAQQKRAEQDSISSGTRELSSGSVKSLESSITDEKKEMEMQSILDSLFDILTPSWFKIGMSFLSLLFTVISIRWYIRKIKKESDGIHPP